MEHNTRTQVTRTAKVEQNTKPKRPSLPPFTKYIGAVNYILPPSQNNYLNFVLTLIQSCTKFKTLILGRRE